ncbi:MAG: 1-deoxy-D-xylulose-5-phosphate synthase [Oscillospiraceae bacterium]|nr:1-deoxy-D-xylulose-5-phosphate synthase [Oscillospiraceae bacterium]
MQNGRILDSIKLPEGISELDDDELKTLCGELRAEILDKVSRTGGHLASNMGAVELTVALHHVFSTPKDAIVWDVGHQCYSHKILTGRDITGIRTENGPSGFPKSAESAHDAFVAGHASTSVSAALGIAQAKKIKGEPGSVIAVVGDGAFSGGMIYEAMNNAGRSGTKLIVVLNDNEMSISKNVGAMARYLAKIRTRRSYFRFRDGLEKFLLAIPLVGRSLRNFASAAKNMLKNHLYGSNYFEHFGFYYLGPVDGHDVSMLARVFERAKKFSCPVLVHINTVKGKGYPPAEQNPSKFHGIAPFNKETGELLETPPVGFSEAFGGILTELAAKDDRICAITAAMPDGTGLSPFAARYPRRFFDVGIAEEHALTFAAGLAAGGMKPVFAVYSTFLQRACDQIIHDASIEQKHIVLAVDRAGIVGGDGETHQGVFDMAILTAVPGVTIYCPADYRELRSMLEAALEGTGVCAVRYPRDCEKTLPENYRGAGADYDLFENPDRDRLIVCYGRLFSEAVSAAEACGASILKLNKVWPLAASALEAAARYPHIFFFEEAVFPGSVAEHFGAALAERGFRGEYRPQNVRGFIPQMSAASALKKQGLDAASMLQKLAGEEGTPR